MSENKGLSAVSLLLAAGCQNSLPPIPSEDGIYVLKVENGIVSWHNQTNLFKRLVSKVKRLLKHSN